MGEVENFKMEPEASVWV